MASCCKNNNVNRYTGSGGSTMMKKHANKFGKISSGKFSINGINNNNIYSTIGNPNPALQSTELCKTIVNPNNPNNNTGVSVKNTRGLLASKCGPLNSAACYKAVNKELIDLYNKDHIGVNKILRPENATQSNRIYQLKSKCAASQNPADLLAKAQSKCQIPPPTSDRRISNLRAACNITKDSNVISGFTPGYAIYYADSTLFKAKSCLIDPPDAKVIGCSRG